MTNTIQKKFKVSSTQLLYQSCPYQAITLFVTGPFLDGLLTNQNVFAFKYTSQVVVRLYSARDSTPLVFLLPSLILHIYMCFFLLTAVLHRLVLSHISICKLQHFPCHWENVSGHISGSGTSENMPGSSIWVCVAARSIQLAQHSRYYGGCDWNGGLFLFLLDRDSAEG